MSTRGAITRITDEHEGKFTGVYHHWDSYPTGLGQTLWGLYHGHFKRDLRAMLSILIDQHPAGWSTINDRDFTLPVGFWEEGPECYCHGDRHEKGQIVTEANAATIGGEWVYAFDETTSRMFVLSSYNENGHKMIGMFGSGNPKATWKVVASVDLNGQEPDWKRLEN